MEADCADGDEGVYTEHLADVEDVFACGACTEVPDKTLSCSDEESQDYLALTKVSNDLLEGIPHRLTRYSSCEDTGSPGAAVEASVPEAEWQTRRDAHRHLRRAGWEPSEATSFLSPDGHFEAYVVLATEPDGTRTVNISIERVRR